MRTRNVAPDRVVRLGINKPRTSYNATKPIIEPNIPSSTFASKALIYKLGASTCMNAVDCPEVCMEVAGWWELVLRIPGLAGWCSDGVTETGSIPDGDVTSGGGGTARNVAMLMDDRFRVPDCIFWPIFKKPKFKVKNCH